MLRTFILNDSCLFNSFPASFAVAERREEGIHGKSQISYNRRNQLLPMAVYSSYSDMMLEVPYL